MSLLKKLRLLRIDALTDIALSRYIENIQNQRTSARRAAKYKKIRDLHPKRATKKLSKRAKKKATNGEAMK